MKKHYPYSKAELSDDGKELTITTAYDANDISVTTVEVKLVKNGLAVHRALNNLRPMKKRPWVITPISSGKGIPASRLVWRDLAKKTTLNDIRAYFRQVEMPDFSQSSESELIENLPKYFGQDFE